MTLVVAQFYSHFGVMYPLKLGDDFIVHANVVTGSRDDVSVTAPHSDHLLTVDGYLYGLGDAMHLGDDAAVDKNITVAIGETGRVGGGFGDTDCAILMMASSSNIINKGLISGATGIRLGGIGIGQTTINNSGTILAIGGFCIEVLATATEDVLFVNTGTVASGFSAVAYWGSSGADTIINSGNFAGPVTLNGGDDVFNNFRGFTRQAAAVFGGAGNDLFLPGIDTEEFQGDEDIDTVSFAPSASGVRASLDNSLEGTGLAKLDIYRNIENLTGSLKGNDWLRGSLVNNSLIGNGGADRLEGLAGDDRLNGGLGIDTLVGGAGDDDFIFESTKGSVDRIVDFGTGRGDDDQIWIDASAFGGNLEDGKPFRDKFLISTTNLAQEKADRFIYRTVDDTLWFDIDGKGGRKAILIAKFDPDATLTAFDFVLY